MSGWRHTMLVNGLMNVIFGRAGAKVLAEELGMRDSAVNMWGMTDQKSGAIQ